MVGVVDVVGVFDVVGVVDVVGVGGNTVSFYLVISDFAASRDGRLASSFAATDGLSFAATEPSSFDLSFDSLEGPFADRSLEDVSFLLLFFF